MPEELTRISDTDGIAVAAGPGKRPDDTIKIVMVANAALVGVPAAFAASGSVLITLVAAAVALCLVVAYLATRGR